MNINTVFLANIKIIKVYLTPSVELNYYSFNTNSYTYLCNYYN